MSRVNIRRSMQPVRRTTLGQSQIMGQQGRYQSLRPSHRQTSQPIPRHSRFSRLQQFTRQSRVSIKAFDDFQLRPSLAYLVRQELAKLNRLAHFQRVYILAKIVPPQPEPGTNGGEAAIHEQFRDQFRQYLIEIVMPINLESLSKDIISGLCLFMGDHMLVIFESSEDMMGNLLLALSKSVYKYWASASIFCVEDEVGEVYFTSIVFRYSSAIHINEKFAPNTADDEELMFDQHFKLRNKVLNICNILSKELRKEPSIDHMPTYHGHASTVKAAKHSKKSIKDGHHAHHHHRSVLYNPERYISEKFSSNQPLPLEAFKKLLPETQRIDLVLNSTRFYRNLQNFANIYVYVETLRDAESYFWPIPNNYTPAGVFQRMPHDFNLTFGKYGEDDTEQEAADELDIEETNATKIEEIPDTEITKPFDELELEEE